MENTKNIINDLVEARDFIADSAGQKKGSRAYYCVQRAIDYLKNLPDSREDYFAGQALTGLLGSARSVKTAEIYAKQARELAKAMVKIGGKSEE